jgi:hypothetical protein
LFIDAALLYSANFWFTLRKKRGCNMLEIGAPLIDSFTAGVIFAVLLLSLLAALPSIMILGYIVLDSLKQAKAALRSSPTHSMNATCPSSRTRP